MILIAKSDEKEIMSMTATELNKENRKQTLIDNVKNLGFPDVIVEVLTDEEYQSRVELEPSPQVRPNDNDRLNELENAILFLMME